MSKKISNSSQRLKEMMDVLMLKQTDIVSTTGITKSALSNYLHGTREPRQDQISRIADPYGINPTWLMGYDVPMYLPREVDYLVELSNQEEILIETFRNLGEESKRQLILMLAFLKEQNKNK